MTDRWAIILGGGEGQRLRSLTHVIAGDAESLGPRRANLAVLRVGGVAWSDWGQPSRVLATSQPMGLRPAWAERALSPSA